MLGRTDSRRRTLVFLLVLVALAGALCLRLAYWQVLRRDELVAMAIEERTTTYEIPARRGSIHDRTGTVVIATTVARDRLAAMPADLEPARRAEVASRLVALLGLEDEAARRLTERMTSDRRYVVLARNLLPEVSERIREESRGAGAALSGLVLEPEEVRVFPQAGGGPGSSLAAHLVGFVNREGAGQYGVEQHYQDLLAGLPTLVAARLDGARNPVPDSVETLEAGVPGQSLTLTIDAGLQVALEQELLAAWIADRARRVSAVVLDPHTGEVYAWGSWPSYDANDVATVAATNPNVFVDPIVAAPYEPGSVMKMLTASAALRRGVVTPETRLVDTARLAFDGGVSVANADLRGKGELAFADAIAQSRNVVTAQVAFLLGSSTALAADRLHGEWAAYGLGAPTGVDVAGERGGTVRDPDERPWREIDLANASFGQGVAVTPIQLAQAFAAMANGGTLVQPRVVRTIGDVETEPVVRGRVVPATVAATLRALMVHVVESVPLYRSGTTIPGVEVGGKTGTAQIWDSRAGAWKRNIFNYSFVGFVGRRPGHPDLVVAVRIEEGTPTTIRQGQLELPVMSFELFRRIAHNALNVPLLVPDGTGALPAVPAGAP